MHPHERAAAAQALSEAIEKNATAEPQGFSWRLGPSALDSACNRRVWYKYRWAALDVSTGNRRRLLERGKREEDRMVGWLRDAGCDVLEFDPAAHPDAMNKQFRVRGVHGHVGGYLDGKIMLPKDWAIPFALVLEMKTANDANFKKVVKDGVRAAKPEYFDQMCIYGRIENLRYALFMMLCKNDDRIHIEIVELDWARAADLMRRFEDIITAHQPPTRISENATDYRCKQCFAFNVCHRGADYERNCRSCEHAVPAVGGDWQCLLVREIIPRDFVKIGCASWKPIGRA